MIELSPPSVSLQACDNIYERLSSRATLKSVQKPEDILEQLRISGSLLEDLIQIVEERRLADLSAKAEASRVSPVEGE